MTDFRSKIISELDILKRVSATETAGIFKVRSYEAAIKTIQSLPPILSISDIPEPTKGDGLGVEIRKKMAKIIETGSLNIAPEVRAKAIAIDAPMQNNENLVDDNELKQ
jgi:DNA polymerase/3'-5' exonuclease PolX